MNGNSNSLVFAREYGKNRDWESLYESQFPVDERQPTEEVKELIESGRIVLLTQRNDKGELVSFSTVSIHDENPEQRFSHVDFIAVQSKLQNNGLGTQHFNSIVKWTKEEHPEFVAVTLEMERRRIDGLDDEQYKQRESRARFYTRLGAKQQPVDYCILNFEDPDDRIQAEWWAHIIRPEAFNIQKVIHAFLTDEGGYQLDVSDAAVIEQMQPERFGEHCILQF